MLKIKLKKSSNNTNKFSPQERRLQNTKYKIVQIIQINLVLKNPPTSSLRQLTVQIIQINLVLKNRPHEPDSFHQFK